MINVIIAVGENTRMVELADMLAAIRAAGFDYRLERQEVHKPVTGREKLGPGDIEAYRRAVHAAQTRKRELRREAETRAAQEQRLPRARFGDWWEKP